MVLHYETHPKGWATKFYPHSKLWGTHTIMI